MSTTFTFHGAYSAEGYPELQSNPELAAKVQAQVESCSQMASLRKPIASVYKTKVSLGGVEYAVAYHPQR